jgi:hypothetical protein
VGLAGVPVTELEPAVCPEEGCDPPAEFDGLPEVGFRDRLTGEFVQFPHLNQSQVYALKDPARWVDPSTGEVEVRFSNDRPDGIGFQFNVQLEGDVH